MGMCKPSGGKTDLEGKFGRSIKDRFGTPNSRADFYVEGKPHTPENLIQQRWYGPDGRAIRDRDWKHNNSTGKHKFPHDHIWDWSKIPIDRPEAPVDVDYC